MPACGLMSSPRLSEHQLIVHPETWCLKQQVSRSLQGLGRGFPGWFRLTGSPKLSARAVAIGQPMAWGGEGCPLAGPLRGQHGVWLWSEPVT